MAKTRKTGARKAKKTGMRMRGGKRKRQAAKRGKSTIPPMIPGKPKPRKKGAKKGARKGGMKPGGGKKGGPKAPMRP